MYITINPIEYRKFLRVRAAANALSKRADAIKATFGLPEANKTTVGEYLLNDGNGQTIGKAVISIRAGYEVKAGFTTRIS